MVTIKDIAKLANVSHTTVSRALNNSPLIKEDTKKKIIDLANQLNYSPNYNAKSLVLQKSHTIGLFFTSIEKGTSPSFFSDTVRGVNRVISGEYNLFVRGIDDYKDFSSITNHRFDGVILMSQSDEDHIFIYHILNQKIPLVVLNREMNETLIHNILSDDRIGAYEAVTYLINEGHRDIAIIEGIEGFKSTKERKEGYIQAMIDGQISIKNEYICKGKYDMASGYEAMESLLSLEKPPSAVFCSNDDMAIGAMNAAFAHRLSIPVDISVVGFDDIGFSQYTNPRLTTVKRPIEKISMQGAEKLLLLMERPDLPVERILVETELKIRDSAQKLIY
ncbi:LacI family DNA-binding transcriptional regulator [Peribacillus huizhouensis]|uniref:LacI family transcriptional regulator n=1 Tax=Peribacillus huizhouensis TaxID=1501239 RepID=A0ABR6CNC8_9BACI|nr:LacI family DNA-binding transcriptional regulator [Peribacillus huizhouensis]MBA9026537.1 LacI family transcriptional regulator [Peribacillus huizhouensis]